MVIFQELIVNLFCITFRSLNIGIFRTYVKFLHQSPFFLVIVQVRLYLIPSNLEFPVKRKFLYEYAENAVLIANQIRMSDKIYFLVFI
jgi:hypothetical protein